MKVIVRKEFLAVPVGTVGEVIEQYDQIRGAVHIQFPGKDAPVHVQWPGAGYYDVLTDSEAASMGVGQTVA